MTTRLPPGTGEFPILPHLIHTPLSKECVPDSMIEHHVLRIDEFSGELSFSVKLKKKHASGSKKVSEYAETISTLRTGPQKKGKIRSQRQLILELLDDLKEKADRLWKGKTPYDVRIDKTTGEKRWVVLELDSKVNWQFAPGTHGVTMKEDYDDENHSLYISTNKNIYPDPAKPYPKDVPQVPPVGDLTNPERCRVVYWGISKRTKDIPAQFNFHVEFYQTTDSEELTMPTIFDPSIPNTGGPEIPS